MNEGGEIAACYTVRSAAKLKREMILRRCACTVGYDLQREGRLNGYAYFVDNEEAYEEEANDQRDSNVSRIPGIADASPCEAKECESRSRSHQDVATDRSCQTECKYSSCVGTHIQSTRASFSQTEPGGERTRRKIETRAKAIPVRGKFRSVVTG